METLAGTVHRIVYRDPGGYAVVELVVPGRLLPVTVVGKLVGVEVGERLEVQGRWTRHPRFGEQFRVEQFSARPPDSEAGLVRYLSSGAVEGIGPGLAARLVAHFGASVFDVAAEQPERLSEVPGIGKKRAATLARALRERRAAREVMVFLQGLGLGPALAARVYQKLGDEVVAKVKADPYRLVQEVDGVGFATADALARELGVGAESPSRLGAGLLHLMQQARERGDTVVPREALVEEATRFLGADEAAVGAALDDLVAQGALLERPEEAGVVVGQPPLVRGEERIARRLKALLARGPTPLPEGDLRAGGVTLTEEQARAVRLAAAGPVAIVTGGPGTGKTTVMRALVELLARAGRRVHLCAPTGRAARRLAEATSAPASTIHRLLGFGGGSGGPRHGRDDPLPEGALIVDEASMLDVPLTRWLLDALHPRGQLVLVGDADQLPSVGPGNVLGDLIASGAVPVARLTTIFRQAEESLIVRNAHAIRAGRLPETSPPGSTADGAFHIVPAQDAARAQRLVLEVVAERIPGAFGLDPVADVQVLAPMHRGDVGTAALNRLLQERLNPGARGLPVAGGELRPGDKVMQVRNDHEREVYNGDIGRVVTVDRDAGALVVAMGGRRLDYGGDRLSQLVLAYCVSIHKSQGSEYPAVVVPLDTQHYLLLQRNLLYTAVTRARRLVVLVGSERAIRTAVSRVDPSRRRTRLAAELRREAGAAA